MKKYDIWKFELVFENCETVDIMPCAIEGLSFKRVGSVAHLSNSLHGMLMVEEETIDNVYIKIALDKPRAIRQLNPSVWTDDPVERVKTGDDITHITINEEYLAVPYSDEKELYHNEYQSIEITDEFIKIRIKSLEDK